MLLPTSKVFTSHDFPLQSGRILERLDVAYETWGTLDAAGNNAILLCHGFTSSPHAAGDESGWLGCYACREWSLESHGRVNPDRFFGLGPDDVPHIRAALAAGLGVTSPAGIRTVEV